jgi:pyridoxal phosphate enzyme (YggS family)
MRLLTIRHKETRFMQNLGAEKIDEPLCETRLREVQSEIEAAALAAGRAPSEVTLLAISKTKPAALIEVFLNLGVRHFGENRVQEAAEKWPDLRADRADLELHLVGPLQSNKVKQAVEVFDVIQTLDREKLARALAAHKDVAGFPKLYIQVNTGAEPQKSGILPQDLPEFHAYCTQLGLTIDGLMAIPPVDEPAARHFEFLAERAAQFGLANVSMGMSNDFATAIACGATHVRVGTSLFGARDTA